MALTLTSAANPRIKHVLKLRERRHRDRESLMLVEGYAELSLALASGARPQTLFLCPALITNNQLPLAELQTSGTEIIEVTPTLFEKIAYRENPDGWLAVIPIRQRTLTDLKLSPTPLVLVAEAIEKPGNLGAMLRSADAVGVDALLVCDPRTDIHNPNVVRASKGTLFSVPVVETDNASALTWLKDKGLHLVAATPQATTLYTEAHLSGPVAIGVGTENEGLSPFWLEQATVSVRIPMRGQVNSLNVATATTLLLYEALRQRA